MSKLIFLFVVATLATIKASPFDLNMSTPLCDGNLDNRPCRLGDFQVKEEYIRVPITKSADTSTFYTCAWRKMVPCTRWNMVYWNHRLMVRQFKNKPEDTLFLGIKIARPGDWLLGDSY